MTDAHDPVPEIAALFAEAEQLAAADRQWFKSRPDRSCRAALPRSKHLGRLAGRVDTRSGLVRGSPTGTEALYFVLPVPNREPREDELTAMWGRAAVVIA